MTVLVDMEYLIGNAFIHLTQERFLTLKDLNNYRIQMQNYWNLNDIDAIITGDIKDTPYYFEFQQEAGLIVLKPNVTKKALEQRFVGYLPIDILLSFQNVAKCFS